MIEIANSLTSQIWERGDTSVCTSSYETTPKWHGFLMIKPATFQASGWAET